SNGNSNCRTRIADRSNVPDRRQKFSRRMIAQVDQREEKICRSAISPFGLERERRGCRRYQEESLSSDAGYWTPRAPIGGSVRSDWVDDGCPRRVGHESLQWLYSASARRLARKRKHIGLSWLKAGNRGL